MPNPPMAKASIDTMRSLTPLELATVRMGLLLITETQGESRLLWEAREVGGIDAILNDHDILALVHELTMCRKVSVCRSNP